MPTRVAALVGKAAEMVETSDKPRRPLQRGDLKLLRARLDSEHDKPSRAAAQSDKPVYLKQHGRITESALSSAAIPAVRLPTTTFRGLRYVGLPGAGACAMIDAPRDWRA